MKGVRKDLAVGLDHGARRKIRGVVGEVLPTVEELVHVILEARIGRFGKHVLDGGIGVVDLRIVADLLVLLTDLLVDERVAHPGNVDNVDAEAHLSIGAVGTVIGRHVEPFA